MKITKNINKKGRQTIILVLLCIIAIIISIFGIEKYISDAQRCGLIIVKGTDIEKTKKKALEVRNRINRDIVRE